MLDNDSDVDGDTLTVTGTTDPSNGSIVDHGDGTVTYTPDLNFHGTDTFAYTISDGNGGTDTATVTVTVLDVNDPPVADDDTGTTDEDTPVTIDVLSNDSDVDGDSLSVTGTTDPSNGSIVDHGDGTVTYTPDPNFHGIDSFTYTISDGNGGTDTATVTITVDPVNDDPDAVNDSDTTPEDTPVTIPVLDNDSDVDGDTLTVTGTTDPSNGSIVDHGDGTVTYTPDLNFHGTDTFTYTISDGNGGTDTATVTVTVLDVNDPPVADDDTGTTDEDTPVTVPVLGNDSDIDGTLDPASVTVTTNPANGAASDNPDGTITYTPDLNFHGTDTFEYQVCDDDGACDIATVTITVDPVNDGPDAVDDADTTDEDTPVTILVLDNDTDVDGDTLTVTGTTAPSNGSVAINGDGTVTYTPDPDFHGIDSFTYTISDGNGGTDTAMVTVTINPINDPPDAVNDSDTTDEDTPVVIPVLDNDTDVDGDPLTVTDASDPANGSVAINGDGTVTYTPDPDFHGIDSFTYTISDGNGGTDTASVILTVLPINDDPDAVDDADTTDEDTPVTILVLDNDTDVDGDTLTVTGTTAPSNGSVAINGDGTVTYTPDPDFHGIDSFTYTISDGNGGTDTAMVTVTINPINDPPDAVNDSDTTDEDTPVVIPVLDNDTDVDGDPLTVTDASDPANGSVAINGDGTVTYTPDPDFHGIDSFTYTISDGNGGTDTASVILTVLPINDDPDAVDDADTTDEDTPVTILVLDNDTDVDGDTLTVTGTTAPSNGSVAINGDGTVTYTPDPDFHGIDSFTYTISDGNGGTDTATVTITVDSVNDAPVAVDDSDSTPEDTPVTIDVLPNDSDVDGDTLTVTGTTDPSNGTIVDQGDGTITYIPDANFHGIDTFTYTIADGNGGSDTATVTVTVADVNDPPIATDDVDSTDEDVPVVIPALDNDNDIDGTLEPSSVTITSDPSNGIAGVNPDGSVTYVPAANFAGIDTFEYRVCDDDGACDAATVTIVVGAVNDPPVAIDDSGTTPEDTPVTIPVLDNDSDPEGNTLTVTDATDPTHGSVTINADGTVTYTPDADFHGTDTFDYTISDGFLGTETATVTVTVDPVNDAPDAVDDSANTDEEVPVAIPVLGNDTDPESDPLAVAGTTDPANGSVTVNADGTITYTPNSNFNGTDTFTYTIEDGNGGTDTATVTVTVDPVNDDPVAVDDSTTTGEDSPVVIPVLDNDTDIDGDTLSVTGATDPANGSVTVNGDGTVTYTPNPDFNGSDSFNYTISDGAGGTDTATVTVTVDPVNDGPDAVNDSDTTNEDTPVVIPVLDNDTDIDGVTLTVTDASDPANGSVTINADGTVTYTPDADFHGIDTFTYTISDGAGGGDTASVIVTVLPINDDPDAVDDTATTPEEVPVVVPVLGNDSDLDGDSLAVTGVTDPANGSVTVNADGTMTYTPDADFNGVDTFEYTISDGNGGTDTATVSVTVNPINDAPVANDDSTTTGEDSPVVIPVAGNDSDPDGDVLTVADVTDPGHGTVVVNADGTVTYTPDADYSGPDSFSYQVCDPNGACDSATVTVDVTPINDPPVANDDLDSTDEDTPVTIPVLVNDTDVDGTVVASTVVVTVDPSSGSVVVNGDGSVTYTPDVNFSGSDSFSYQVCDDDDACDTATVVVTVNPINDAPVAVDDGASTSEDTSVVVPVLGNDTDIDGDPLTVTDATDPANGSVTVNADGTITYTPNPNFNGTDTFTYQVCDPDNECDAATVSVTVDPVNDDPIAIGDLGTTPQDTSLTVPAPGLLDNDSDPENDLLSVTGATDPANGSVTVNTDGSFTYVPDPGYVGADTFDYTISDGNGGTDTASVLILVNPFEAPTAVDDDHTTPEDTPLVVPAPGVLGNDTDPEGAPLVVSSATDPTNGTVAMSPDGSFVYTPDSDFHGIDTFTYESCDPTGLCDSATVRIEVTPANDPPVANDDLSVTLEEVPVVVPVLGNDSDLDGDSLAVTGVTDPANGSVTVNADGTMTYTPDADFNGVDTFEYTISDGNGGTDTATVSVTVNPINDAPVANDDSTTTGEDSPVVIPVAGNDSDPDGDVLTVADVTDPGHGTVVVNADGTVTYTPDADYSGPDSFSYQVCDPNGACDSATVTVDVTPINDPPVANDDLDSTDEDTPVTIPVLVNDTDVDGTVVASTVVVTVDPSSGSVVVNGDGSVTYTPDVNFSGSDSFSYQVCDDDDACDTATVVVTVNPINDAPVAVDDGASTSEDTSVVVPVLGNDTDIDGDPLTVTDATDPANGSVTVNADGTITYTPNPNFNGTDTFTYTISDGQGGVGTATVTVVVDPDNDGPTAVDDGSSTPEDTPVVIPVLDNDTDPDVDPLSVTGASSPANGTATVNTDGTITYTPNPNFSGEDSFDYTISDGAGGIDTATVTVTVEPVNDAPVAVDDNAATSEDTPVVVPVLGNDTDPEGDPLTVATATVPANGSVTVNADGTITYTPSPNFNGTDTFTYTVEDGNGGSATATVTVVVEPANDGPVAVDDEGSIPSDTPVVIHVLSNDTDIDGDPLTVTDVTDPTNGLVTVNPDGTITYTPNPGFLGVDTFEYTISDGNGGTDTATVTLTATPANHPPAFTDDPTNTDQTTTVGGSLVPLTASDPDGDPYTFILADGMLPPGVTLSNDGTFGGSPAAAGTFISTVRVCDIHGLCVDGSLTIRVQANQLPKTGMDVDLLAMIGSLLTLLGGFLVFGSRRRREAGQ